MNPNLPRFEHMLRSRTRSFGFPSPSEPPGDSILEKSKTPRRPSQLFPVFDTGLSTIYKILVLSVTLGAIVFILFWPETTIVLRAASPPASTLIPSFTAAPPARPRLVPLVDRSILQRLADMEVSPDPDERPYFTSSPQQRPPLVTRIPEARKPLDPFLAPDICSTPGTPCRFLLPLRIGEQESKARVHLMEILQLAQRLDRILVLPNVGKSRIGTCFKSGLETYYDLKGLTDDLELPVATVKLDLFRHWVSANAPSAQLGSLSFRQESHLGLDAVTFSNEDVSIHVGSFDSNPDLPGCLAKFSALRLDAHAPLYIHLKPHAHTRPIATSIVDALTRPDIQAAASFPPSTSESESPDPAVLILTWDLRTPIFSLTAHRPTLHYAPRLHALAAALAPRAPYAMVHWRMESVAPARLPQCAHALVDTLARLGGVRTVWFTSDYPHAVHRSRGDIDFGATGGGVAPEAKSGTFRNVGPLHAEAMGIIGDAFAAGGELEGWAVAELTDAGLAAALDGDWDSEPELLEDVGVRTIVEKLIGMQAALFVSGAPGCARTSSFTQQVVDERRNVLDRLNHGDELPILQNVIELFG